MRTLMTNFLAVLTLAATISTAALAGNLPQQTLLQEKEGCMTSCQLTYPAQKCQTYCSCVLDQMDKSLTADEFKNLPQSQPGSDLFNKVQAITMPCLQQIMKDQ